MTSNAIQMGKAMLKKNKAILRMYRKWNESLPYLRYQISGSPIPPPYEIKHFWLKHFQQRFSLTTFIETGTYQGWTVDAMLTVCNKIYSVELDPTLAINAQNKFQSCKHVKIIQGDSAQVLEQILAQVTDRCLFWLDGHFSGDGTGSADKETPIMEELYAIGNHSRNDHIILVDDARLFDGTKDYSTIDIVCRKLVEINSKFNIRIKDDMVQCFPES